MKKKIVVIGLCLTFVLFGDIPLEEYDALNTPSIPTVLTFSSSRDQLLTYIGTSHDNNPQIYQYRILDHYWKLFLKYANSANAVVICETLAGDDTYNGYATKTSAIIYGGDCGYATWLGQSHAFPVIGAELSHKTVIQQLLKEFDRDHVYYFCFALATDFWTRYDEKPNLEQFVLKRVQRWTDTKTITFKQLTDLHEKYTGKILKTPERNFFVRLMTLTYHTSYLERALTYFSIPTSVLAIIYPLLRRSHQLRDSHTLNIIQEQWKTGKHLFIVYGALHAVTLKKYLEQLTH